MGSCVLTLSRVPLFVIAWTVARQAPVSVGSPGKNTGVGCRSLLHAGSQGSSTFNFVRNSVLFSTVAALVTLPPTAHEGPFPTPAL